MSRRVDFVDLSGQRFGKIKVVSFAYSKKRVSHWNCLCDCGKEFIARSYYLKGNIISECRICRKDKRPSQYVDVSGKKFNKLTAVSLSHIDRKSRTYFWNCLCDCGKEVVVNGTSLRRGYTKSCGCLKKTVPGRTSYKLEDMRFGKLIVKEKVGSKNNKVMWRCLCDCGKETTLSSNSLVTNRARSCGCLKIEFMRNFGSWRKLPHGEAGLNHLFSEYKKKNAERRDLSFELSKERFKELTQGNCYYCNASLLKESNGYKYNGIDRIDNTKGYVEGNVVSCCFKCNTAKSDMAYQEFKDWVKKIFNFFLAQ